MGGGGGGQTKMRDSGRRGRGGEGGKGGRGDKNQYRNRGFQLITSTSRIQCYNLCSHRALVNIHSDPNFCISHSLTLTPPSVTVSERHVT